MGSKKYNLYINSYLKFTLDFLLIYISLPLINNPIKSDYKDQKELTIL